MWAAPPVPHRRAQSGRSGCAAGIFDSMTTARLVEDLDQLDAALAVMMQALEPKTAASHTHINCPLTYLDIFLREKEQYTDTPAGRAQMSTALHGKKMMLAQAAGQASTVPRLPLANCIQRIKQTDISLPLHDLLQKVDVWQQHLLVLDCELQLTENMLNPGRHPRVAVEMLTSEHQRVWDQNSRKCMKCLAACSDAMQNSLRPGPQKPPAVGEVRTWWLQELARRRNLTTPHARDLRPTRIF